jgi:hypothetical protein
MTIAQYVGKTRFCALMIHLDSGSSERGHVKPGALVGLLMQTQDSIPGSRGQILLLVQWHAMKPLAAPIYVTGGWGLSGPGVVEGKRVAKPNGLSPLLLEWG